MCVSISDLIKPLNLKLLLEDFSIKVKTTQLNRPGLQLTGYYSYFSNDRIQLIGMTEWSYMNSLDEESRDEKI